MTGNSGKQVADTYVRKLFFMIPAFVSLVLHLLYLVTLNILNSSTGMVLPFAPHSFGNVGQIILLIWGRIAYLYTHGALNESLAAYCGYLLNRKEGFSIAVCGFVQGILIHSIIYL